MREPNDSSHAHPAVNPERKFLGRFFLRSAFSQGPSRHQAVIFEAAHAEAWATASSLLSTRIRAKFLRPQCESPARPHCDANTRSRSFGPRVSHLLVWFDRELVSRPTDFVRRLVAPRPLSEIRVTGMVLREKPRWESSAPERVGANELHRGVELVTNGSDRAARHSNQ